MVGEQVVPLGRIYCPTARRLSVHVSEVSGSTLCGTIVKPHWKHAGETHNPCGKCAAVVERRKAAAEKGKGNGRKIWEV